MIDSTTVSQIINVVIVIAMCWSTIFIARKLRDISASNTREGGGPELATVGLVERLQAECTAKMIEMANSHTAQMNELKISIERIYTEKIEELQAQLRERTDVMFEYMKRNEVRTQAPFVITQALPADQIPPEKNMLVALGEDQDLWSDINAIDRAQMKFHRLRPSSTVMFGSALNRARLNGKPFRYVHISMHTSEEGCEFQDKLATPEWLSEQLKGVEVLLIAGCESTSVGDWISGIAKYVVTMSEPLDLGKVPMQSGIGIFTTAFWSAIKKGLSPEQAFDTAVERSPSWIEQIAYFHDSTV